MSGNVWIIFGGIAAAFAAIAIPYGFHLKAKGKSSAKIHEINIKQEGGSLSNVTGAEISNAPSKLELGKVDVDQEGKNLKHVTGLKLEFDGNSGEVELKGKMRIKQRGPHGESALTVNTDQPDVNVIFNKKPENKKSDE